MFLSVNKKVASVWWEVPYKSFATPNRTSPFKTGTKTEDLRRSHIGQMFVFGSLLSTSLTIDNLLTLPFRHIKVTTDKPILRFSCGNNNAITLTAYIYPNTETTSCLSNKTDVFKYKIQLSSCYLCLSIVKITGVSVFVSSYGSFKTSYSITSGFTKLAKLQFV